MKLDLGGKVDLWNSLGKSLWSDLSTSHTEMVEHTLYNYIWADLNRDLWLSVCDSQRGRLRDHMRKPL